MTPPSCRAPASVQRVAAQVQQEMGRNGEDSRSYYCRWCRSWHTLTALDGQTRFIEAPPRARSRHRAQVRKARKPAGWCNLHQTASRSLSAPCAYRPCPMPVHIHISNLKGRGRQRYLVERCSGCLRYNAVVLVRRHGRVQGVRTHRLEGGQVVYEDPLI